MSKVLRPEVAKVLEALGDNSQKNVMDQNQADMLDKKLSELTKEELAEYAKNANEVMHTENTGFGKELIARDVLQQQIVDLIPKYGTFYQDLTGFHGTNMAVSERVPIVGEVGLFARNSEPTTGALEVGQANRRMATGEVVITQGQFIAKVAISKRELNYSVGDLATMVRERLAKDAVRTIEASILNGDSVTAGTGNVNSDDSAPASDSYYLEFATGLRKSALATALNAGTLDLGDFFALKKRLGYLTSDMSQCMWLMNNLTYDQAMQLDHFVKANERGRPSTISGNAIDNILGADVFTPRDLALTEADGKISATPSNNTKGQMLLLYKPAIQHGFGQPLEIEVEVVPGKGVNLVATFEWGFALANQVAGQADQSVASAINITV